MSTKLVDIDIHGLTHIRGLEGYDAVDILFRDGRDPIGRSRIACNNGSLDIDKLRTLSAGMAISSPANAPSGTLPSITVAICTRNRPAELSKALLSLARQEHPADEIIIVDNGCQEQVRMISAKIYPDARYMKEQRPGLDFARNRAVLEATEEIIAFLDDDTEADPFWVLSIKECFASFPKAGAVTGLILPLEMETVAQELFEVNGGFERGFSRRVLPHDRKIKFGLKLPIVAEAIGVGSGCNMAIRTHILKELGGFDDALDTGPPLPGGGDLDIFYRVMRMGHELVYEPRALVRHRHRRSKAEIQAQLQGHHRSLSAFLIKTIFSESVGMVPVIVLFLIWRLTKTGFRVIQRLIGKEELPLHFLLLIFWAGFVGLGSYQISRLRIRKILQNCLVSLQAY